jgi:ppGpp synthetase/RelA/SpoT-type nucleotidyltranferase
VRQCKRRRWPVSLLPAEVRSSGSCWAQARRLLGVPLPFSKNQARRLGERLKTGDRPSADDLALLQSLLEAYDEALEVAVKKVRDGLNVRVSSRIKNTGTIIEKLRRPGASLNTIQDLAGMRIVMDERGRRAQDSLVARLTNLFEEPARPVKQIDRRADPRSGYRAVHLVVHVNDVPVEIQVRTELQHEWAELFEKLADRLGRGIRYGEQTSFGNLNNRRIATDISTIQGVGDGAVRIAHLYADLISTIEEEEAQGIIDKEKSERNRARVQRIMEVVLEALDLIKTEIVGSGTVSK